MHINRPKLILLIAESIAQRSHGNTTNQYRESLKNSLKMCQQILKSDDYHKLFQELKESVDFIVLSQNQKSYVLKLQKDYCMILNAPHKLKEILIESNFDEHNNVEKFQVYCALKYGFVPKTRKDFRKFLCESLNAPSELDFSSVSF